MTPAMHHAKVVVVGSSAIDINFGVDNFPVPGREIRAPIRLRPGGKGFFSAIGCSHLEARTALISSVAPDAFGERIKRHLENENVILCFEDSEAQQQTDLVAVFQNSSAGKTAYVASRDSERLSVRFLEKQEVVDLIKDYQVILISLDVALTTLQKVIEIARALRKPVVVNASPPSDVPLSLLKGTNKGADRGDIDFVVATKSEAQAWLRHFPRYARNADNMPADEVAETIQDQGAKYVVISTDDDREDTCIVADQRHVYTYETFKSLIKLGSNGARSAFCSALTVSYAAWLASAPAQGTPPPIDSIINFAAAARHFAYQDVEGGQPSLANVQAFLTGDRRGATLVSTKLRNRGDIDGSSTAAAR